MAKNKLSEKEITTIAEGKVKGIKHDLNTSEMVLFQTGWDIDEVVMVERQQLIRELRSLIETRIEKFIREGDIRGDAVKWVRSILKGRQNIEETTLQLRAHNYHLERIINDYEG